MVELMTGPFSVLNGWQRRFEYRLRPKAGTVSLASWLRPMKFFSRSTSPQVMRRHSGTTKHRQSKIHLLHEASGIDYPLASIR
jgi:hypothetical protein